MKRFLAAFVSSLIISLGPSAAQTLRIGLQEDPDTLDGVLETFSRYRLVTFDREPATGEATVEVAHEALLRSWGRLRAWRKRVTSSSPERSCSD